MSIDKNEFGKKHTSICKRYMRRDWKAVANFIQKNNLVIVLRDIIFLKPRESEKDIDFLRIFNNKALWLFKNNKRIDDIHVIMLSSIMSCLLKRKYYYMSNDNMTDHKMLIDALKRQKNVDFENIKFKYYHKHGFDLVK